MENTILTSTKSSAKVKKYRVSARQAYKHPNAVTLVPSDLSVKIITKDTQVVSVSLGGKESRRILPETAERPAMEMVSLPASQDQLKWLYDVEKHPHIEEYEE